MFQDTYRVATNSGRSSRVTVYYQNVRASPMIHSFRLGIVYPAYMSFGYDEWESAPSWVLDQDMWSPGAPTGLIRAEGLRKLPYYKLEAILAGMEGELSRRSSLRPQVSALPIELHDMLEARKRRNLLE